MQLWDQDSKGCTMSVLSENNVQVDEVSELLVEIEKEYLMNELENDLKNHLTNELNEFSEITELPEASDAGEENRVLLFKVTAKNGLKINVFSDKLIFLSRGRNTEIPRYKVTGITVKKSLAESIRLEYTLVLDLECGRVVTLSRIPASKAGALKAAILAPL